MGSNKKLKILVNGSMCEATFNKETRMLSYQYDSARFFTKVYDHDQLFDFLAEGISIYDA